MPGIMPRGDVVDAANQPRNGAFEPAMAEVEADSEKTRFETGAYGELMRRAKEKPLGFTFDWRGSNFKGKVESIEDGMRLSLRSALAAIPYSAEDADSRGDLLAVVDTCSTGVEAKLTVYQGRSIMIEHEIDLPPCDGDTMATIVTQLTMLVMNTAPYLDLIAEFTAAQAEA
jgi:hypothetical protein